MDYSGVSGWWNRESRFRRVWLFPACKVFRCLWVYGPRFPPEGRLKKMPRVSQQARVSSLTKSTGFKLAALSKLEFSWNCRWFREWSGNRLRRSGFWGQQSLGASLEEGRGVDLRHPSSPHQSSLGTSWDGDTWSFWSLVQTSAALFSGMAWPRTFMASHTTPELVPAQASLALLLLPKLWCQMLTCKCLTYRAWNSNDDDKLGQLNDFRIACSSRFACQSRQRVIYQRESSIEWPVFHEDFHTNISTNIPGYSSWCDLV